MQNEVIKKDEENQSLINSQETQNKNYFYIVIILIILLLLNVFYFIFYTKSGIKVLVNEKDFIKPLSDDRVYRIVRLENHLDAVLISDPKATKSSASLSVGVGSFMDPLEALGLAHFCEHMLFLGSKSYPRVGEFEDLLVANSGYNNAFTESEKTTYFYEVDVKGFNRTLHMFSRMFAEPLFDMSFMNREIDAVNSEHEKNLNSDNWRKLQLFRSMSNPNHPLHKFSTGSNLTLRSVPSETLNNLLHKFYQKYYSSHNMKLAVVTNLPIDEIFHLVKSYFSDIKYRHDDQTQSSFQNMLYGNLETSEVAFRNEDLGKTVYIKKIGAGGELDIYFSLPPTKILYKTKPLDYLDYLISHSGENSLLNFLRKRNYANRIDSAISFSYNSFSFYQISVELTNEGLEQHELIVRLIFNFINMIKSKNVSRNIYEELKKIYEVNFNFLEKNDEYSKYLSSLSTKMFDYDYIDIVKGDYLHQVFNETLIKSYLNHLTPEKSLIFVSSEKEFSRFVSKDVLNSHQVEKEKWYKTEHIVSKLNETYLNVLNQYPVKFNKNENIDPEKSFRVRGENKFITNSNQLIKDCSELNVKCEDEFDKNNEDYTPISIGEESNLKIFYKIDKTFKTPKVIIIVKILSSLLKNKVNDYLYFKLISNYLEYNLSILLSDPSETGNAFSVEEGENGLTVTVSAFSDIAPKMMELIVNEIFKLNPDQLIFKEILEITVKKLNEEINSKPIYKNIKVYFRKLIKFKFTTYREILDNIKIEKPSFESFRDAYEIFRKDLLLSLFFYGNIEVDEMKKIIDLTKSFTERNLKSKTKVRKNTNMINSSEELINSIHLQRRIDSPVTFQIKNDAENEMNHAVSSFYQVGPRDNKNSLYLSVIEKCLGQIFFYNLRTVQQLGYIVHAGYTSVDSVLYYRILVQGSKKNPQEIDLAIDDVINKATEKISECKADKFEEIRSAIKQSLLKKDDNLKERASRIWKEISLNTYEFNRNKNLLKPLEEIDSSTLKVFYENIFYKNPARFTIHNYSGLSKLPFVKNQVPYNLNKKINVSYTDDINYFSKSEFIHGIKTQFKLRRVTKKSKKRQK